GQRALHLELTTELLVLTLEQRPATQQVDGTVLRGGHEPGTRLVRDARLRPPLERGDEGLLGEVLGHADVAHDSRDPRDDPRGLDPPDRLDRALGLGGRHGLRSQHLPPLVQARGGRRHSLPSQHGPSSLTSTVAHPAAGPSPAIATASSLVRQSSRKNPPTISLDSANGPSTTLRLPLRIWMRAP